MKGWARYNATLKAARRVYGLSLPEARTLYGQAKDTVRRLRREEGKRVLTPEAKDMRRAEVEELALLTDEDEVELSIEVHYT